MADLNIIEILKSFNELVAEKGKVFKIIFYLFFGIYVISLLVSLISSLLELSISVLFPLVWLILTAYFIKKKYIYIILVLSLLSSFALFSIFSLSVPLLTFMPLQNEIFCCVILALISLGGGMLFAFLFDKASNTSLKLIISSVIFSSIGSIHFVILKMAFEMAIFSETIFGGIPMEGAAGGYINLISDWSYLFVSPTILFAVFLFFFNIPFILYFLTREDKKYKYLLLYLIPILIFVISLILIYPFLEIIKIGIPY